MTDIRLSQTASEALVQGVSSPPARLSQAAVEALIAPPLSSISAYFSHIPLEILVTVAPAPTVGGDLLNGFGIPIGIPIFRTLTKRI